MDPAERAELEQHLTACPACRAELASDRVDAVTMAATGTASGSAALDPRPWRTVWCVSRS